MVCLAIAAVLAGTAAPAVARALRDRRTSEATHEVVRAFWVARSSAAGYGVAHVARFDETGDDGRGSLEVIRGASNGCNHAGFGDASLPVVTTYAGSAFDDEGYRLVLRTTQPYVEVCFEPTGTVSWRASAGARFSASSPMIDGRAQGGFRFRLERIADGALEGVSRRIVVPMGGDARVAR